ncbi:bifunctional DNA primase/polymerase [Streptomyces sp. NBC_01476]|uniref:bifunctional DNA primase/polymerase n=1 Tax=Streptomyces sp. NBC_01476 TaxID=2903881 RepID=UPI003FCDA436
MRTGATFHRVLVDAMDEWHALNIVTEAQRRQHTAYVTADGAAWLASASAFPRSVTALWSARPTAPSVLPCGTAFDVVNLPALFGRRVLEQLWAAGPGSGPVALHRSRVLLFTAPGTAHRLPSLLEWEEWRDAMPPMLCHGAGDAVTVPPLYAPEPVSAGDACEPGTPGAPGAPGTFGTPSRWAVAPDTRHPWLPTADHLLRACVRAARGAPQKSVPPLVSPDGTA